jgi:hypothetical protein
MSAEGLLMSAEGGINFDAAKFSLGRHRTDAQGR